MPKPKKKPKQAEPTTTRWLEHMSGSALVQIDLSARHQPYAWFALVKVSVIRTNRERSFIDTRQVVATDEGEVKLAALRVAVEMCAQWMGQFS